jgi:hypothetical protein
VSSPSALLAAVATLGWTEVLLRLFVAALFTLVSAYGFSAVERHGGHVVSLDVAQEGDRRSVAVDVELLPSVLPAVVAGV